MTPPFEKSWLRPCLNRYLFLYLYIAHVPLEYVLVIEDQAKLVNKDKKCTWR